MEIIRNLFQGFPSLWGGGVAHSVMIVALVITIGLALGKIKVARVSLDLMWVLFVGLLFGYMNFNLDPHLLHFLKEFGLILFVYAIGLEMGSGFFSSFKKGGFNLNMLALIVVGTSVVITIVLHYATGQSMTTLAGLLAGAVTNTPGLGAAQQATSDLTGVDAPGIAVAYAMAYPIGVVGVILTFKSLRCMMRINKQDEENLADKGLGSTEELTVRPFSVEILNDRIEGDKVAHIKELINRKFIISRVLHKDAETHAAAVNGNTLLHVGDKVLIIAKPTDIVPIAELLGKEVEMDWSKIDNELISRRIQVTKQDANGKSLSQLKLRTNFGVNVTRVNRSGIDLIATSQLKLQLGDKLTVVGRIEGIAQTEKLLGNQLRRLNLPNLIPIFLGIALGCILANVPFFIPGVSESLKLGLTGGPFVVAILMGYFGPKYNLVTYNTMSANMMISQIGICVFLACVGLGSGRDFISTLSDSSNLQWLAYGAVITIVPILIGGFIGRYVYHLNFFVLLGVLAGANTNPPALNYSLESTTNDLPSVGYSTVYPCAMFLRIISIQLLILIFA